MAFVPCRAHAKGSGKPCKFAPVPGRTLCRYHGGLSLMGAANPNFKHGRYSRVMPQRLLDVYQASLKDPDLLGLRNEIASVDARLSELFGSMDTGDSTSVWRELQGFEEELAKAERSNDVATMGVIMRQMRQSIRRGAAIGDVWEEIFQTQNHRRKLVDTERKRLQAMNATITAEQALSLVAAVVDIIRRFVTDRSTLAAISNELNILLNRDSGTVTGQILEAVVEPAHA